jgi:predicted Kef-type K+ transport protein
VSLAKQLAEIGIILLMFGVGLHFSLKDLLDSRKIALALSKGLLPQDLYNLILAGALLSIVINPFLFRYYDYKFSAQKSAQ